MKTEQLTSRDRVINAINHRPLDRVPIDLGAHFSTGISAVAYWNLREYLGLDTGNIEMIDCVQGLARVDEDIMKRFHIDTVLLNPPWPTHWKWSLRGKYSFWVPETFRPQLQRDGGYRVEFHQEQMYMPAGGFFFDGAWPDFYDMTPDEKLEFFARRAEYLYKETDKFTLMMGFSAYFGGLDFACDMLTDPEVCHQQNQTELERNIRLFDRVNRRFGRYIGAIEINSDLGMQNAPMCSPDSYAEVCLPYLKQFCGHVHKNSDIKVFLHSCGSIAPLIPHLIEAGVDVLNPVQVSAEHMNPEVLKHDFGSKICFWGGGCDTQNVLWCRSADEVAENVAKEIQCLKPGGGFVFNQVHNIMGNVPPENIVRMLDTAYEHSWYSSDCDS